MCKSTELLAQLLVFSHSSYNHFGESQSETVKPPIFSTKVRSHKWKLIENMWKENIIFENYKMFDVLKKNVILHEKIFRKVSANKKKNHVQSYLKLLTLYKPALLNLYKMRLLTWGNDTKMKPPKTDQKYI